MSKQLKTFIMQTIMFAALALTGLGVQANKMSPVEHVQLQGHSMSMDSGCADKAAQNATVAGGENPSGDCDMDAADCHSSCANCQASSDYAPVAGCAGSTSPIRSVALAVISAHYPIDHPPKRSSSL